MSHTWSPSILAFPHMQLKILGTNKWYTSNSLDTWIRTSSELKEVSFILDIGVPCYLYAHPIDTHTHAYTEFYCPECHTIGDRIRSQYESDFECDGPFLIYFEGFEFF